MVLPLTRTRLLSLALTASLGANLFIAGWFLLGGTAGNRHGPFGRDAIKEELRSSLSKAGAIEVIYALDQVHGEFETRLDEARARRENKSDLLTSEPFDRKAFLKDREQVRASFVDVMAKADAIVADAVAQLSLDDRHKLASMRLPPPFGEPGQRRPHR